MGAGCGQRRTNLAAPSFSLPFPAPKESTLPELGRMADKLKLVWQKPQRA
jgi:hypothetical protein